MFCGSLVVFVVSLHTVQPSSMVCDAIAHNCVFVVLTLWNEQVRSQSVVRRMGGLRNELVENVYCYSGEMEGADGWSIGVRNTPAYW